MRAFPWLAVFGMAATACGQRESEAEPNPVFIELFGGALSAGNLESSDNGMEVRLVLVANEPGWLRIGYGPEGVSNTIRVTDLPYRRELRLLSELVEAGDIVERYVAPFFGREAAERLQSSAPDAKEKKLLYSTLFLESLDSTGGSSASHFITPVPAPYGWSSFGLALNRESSTIDGPVRIAGWVHMQPPEAGFKSASWSIQPDMIEATINGKPIEFDGTAAVFRELTIEYSSEPLSGPSQHRCAVANRRCPENPIESD